MNNIVNAERRGKRQVLIRPSSKVVVKFLSVMQRHGELLHAFGSFKPIILIFSGYIGEFEIIDDHRSGKIVIQLNGRLNKTGVISPRFNIQNSQIESWVNLLLPARSFGIIILVRISTFASESLLWIYLFITLVRPLLQGSLTMRKLVGGVWEENSWAMCIKRCSSCWIINLRHLLGCYLKVLVLNHLQVMRKVIELELSSISHG